MAQDGIAKRDSFGGEYKAEGAQTLFALWLPVTEAEKDAQIAKAVAEGTTISALVKTFLDDWLSDS